MPDTIYLDAYCAKVNKEFVGFGLYKGPKVKPVHIANGVFRVLYGKILNNKGIKKLALVQSKKGIKGFDTTDIYDELLEKDRIEEDIKIEDLISRDESFKSYWMLILVCLLTNQSLTICSRFQSVQNIFSPKSPFMKTQGNL